MLPLISEGGLGMPPPLRSMHAIEAGHVGAVRRVAARDDAGGKAHRPRHVLFNLVETAVMIDDRSVSFDVRRLLAGEVPAGVQRVDADVHHRTAATELPGVAPLAAVNVEAVRALDGLDLAELAIADQLNRAHVGRLVGAAVSDHELPVL